MYQYPYGDTQQLNLDWILTKIKELEAGSGGGSSIEEVANTLISATYNAATQYRRYDYCFYNGKLYRCLSDTTGAFTPADWQEALIGDDIPILTRLINAVDASLTSLQTTVGNQGNAITTLQNTVGNLDSDDVDNASLVVSGDTVTDALDNLQSAIALLDGAFKTVKIVSSVSDFGTTSCFFSANTNITLTPTQTVVPIYSKGLFITTGVDSVLYAITSGGELITAYRNGANWSNIHNFVDTDNKIQSAIAIVADGSTHATITEGQYVYIKNHATLAEGLYKALASTPANTPITSTSVSSVPNGLANAALEESSTEIVLSNKNVNAQITKIGRFCFLESNQDFSSLANGLQIIGTIPSGFRPARYTRFVILNKTASQEAVAYYGTIYVNGNIEIYWGGSTIGTATNGAFNVFYLCEV